MKIIDASIKKYFLVETDEESHPEYRRSADSCVWERCYGGSWEAVNAPEDIEAAFRDMLFNCESHD